MNRKEFFGQYEIRDHLKIPQQSLVLNHQQWNGILQHLHRGEDVQIINEQERVYQNYLRTASKEMSSQWENSNDAIRNKKKEERLKKEQEKILEGEKRYKELMENDERKRMEHINKAYGLMRSFQAGPRQLESSAILSEVLKGRDIQRNINLQIKKQLKEQDTNISKEIVEQARQWIEDQNETMIANQKRDDSFKRDLYNFAKETAHKRQEKVTKMSELERKMREAADQELKEQIVREQATLQRKKDLMRKNALEAMRMAEQRRLRDKQENEIDDKIISIYADSKKKIADIAKTKENESKIACFKRKEQLATQWFERNISNMATEDDQKNKANDEEKLKEKQRNQIRIDYEKKMKAARIQHHLDDMEHEKKMKLNKIEEIHWDVANRMKNDEVNLEYEKEKRKQKIIVAFENRKILLQQIEEKLRKNKNSNSNELKFILEENNDNDKMFFGYADELIQDAKNKGRSTQPLLKAIEIYKNENRLNSPKSDLPHLVSHIPIMKDCKSCVPIKYTAKQLNSMNPYGKIYE